MITIISHPESGLQVPEIKGGVTEEDAVKLMDSECSGIYLSTQHGCDGDLVSVAKHLRNFSGQVNIFSTRGLLNVEPLMEMKSLRRVDLGGILSGRVDLNVFENLDAFGVMSDSKKTLSFSGLYNSTVKELRFDGYFFPKSAEMPVAIRSIEIIKPVFPIEELVVLNRLKSLEIHRNPKLSSIDFLHDMNLDRLALTTCKNIQSYEVFACLAQLKYLEMENCPNIPRVELIAHMQCLEKLYLIGIKFLESDLSAILKMPKLKDIGIAFSRNYKPSRDEIYAAINGK